MFGYLGVNLGFVGTIGVAIRISLVETKTRSTRVFFIFNIYVNEQLDQEFVLAQLKRFHFKEL